jgi:AraC-like DNA-binding protein
MALLNSYVRFASQQGAHLTARTAPTVGRHLAELVALAMGSRAVAALDATCLARRQAIMDELDKALADPTLSLPLLAARIGMPTRTLQTAFEEGGTSYSAELSRRRLARAHALLSDHANRDRRVIDIALACGFADVSHFNRQFRAYFGTTPTSVRNSR